MNLTKDSSYQELASRLKVLKDMIKTADDALSELKAEKAELEKSIIPEKMNDDGMQNVTVKGVGRLSIRADMQVGVLAENRYSLHQWLEANGFGELITETVNSSTLKAFVKEQINEGNELPLDLINIHAYELVTLTKA